MQPIPALSTQQVVDRNIRLTEPVERGGGPVYDMGVYCINAARYLFQDDPAQIYATGASSDEPRFQKAGEMVSAVLQFPGERIAAFHVSHGTVNVCSGKNRQALAFSAPKSPRNH